MGNLVDEAAWKLSQYVKNLKPWEGINKYHEVMRTRLLDCDALGQDGVSKIERIPKLTATSAPTELAENVRKINEIILDVIKNPNINNFMNFRYQAPCKNNADEKSASTLFGSLLQTIAKQLLTKSKIASELKRDLGEFFNSCCQELRTKRITGVDDAEAHVTKFVHQADRFLLHEYQERAPVIYKKLQDWIDTPFSKYMSILGWEASAAWGSKAFSELWKNELVLAPTEEKDRTVRYLCVPAAAVAAERVRNDKICFWPTKNYNMKHSNDWGAIRNFYNTPLRSGGRFFKGFRQGAPQDIKIWDNENEYHYEQSWDVQYKGKNLWRLAYYLNRNLLKNYFGRKNIKYDIINGTAPDTPATETPSIDKSTGVGAIGAYERGAFYTLREIFQDVWNPPAQVSYSSAEAIQILSVSNESQKQYEQEIWWSAMICYILDHITTPSAEDNLMRGTDAALKLGRDAIKENINSIFITKKEKTIKGIVTEHENEVVLRTSAWSEKREGGGEGWSKDGLEETGGHFKNYKVSRWRGRT